MKEIKDLFSLVGGPLKASTKSHILASTSDIYDEFWGTYLNVINEYNSNPLDAFLVQNKGIITEIIDSTKIQTLTKTTLNAGDLCLGIYKDDTLTNSKYDYSEGEYLIPGYKSVYFTISEISNDHITVTAEKDEIKPNTIFVVIGNNKKGINFSLNTEDLKADFINVKAFKIEEANIKNISGKFKYNGVECVGTLLNKIYTSNSIGYLNNTPSLNSAFKSNVFTRTNTTPGKPSPDVIEVNGIKYNTYDNPIPGDVNDKNELIWSDGIPEGNAALWASTRIFSSDGKYPLLEVWTAPKQMTDMADFAVAFSSVEDNPGDPANNPDNWASTADENTIWMATSTCKNGVWSAWQISKIKGEKGNDGTSISILGSARKVDVLPTELGTDKALLFTNHLYEGKTHPWIYLWNKTLWEAYSGNAGESYLVDGNLYVWDGDSWENAGSFKGDKGESAYIHIKYAKQDDGGEEVTLVDGSTIKLSFTDSNGEVPGLYLGLKPDNKSEDSKDITDYTWAKWKGEDGFGYEYIYIGTEEYKNPEVPESKPYNGKSPNDDDYVPENWSDNPIEINSEVKYCWMCYRQKVDGVWSNYKGVDDQHASLWAKWSEDGKGITSITRKYLVSNSTNKDDVINKTWSESSPAVNSENIYLWEWIHTEYSTGTPDDDYAIIGRMGEPGIDGKYNEYIYCLTNKNEEPNLPNKEANIGNDEGGWTDDPKSVSEEWPYQWISEREYDPSQKQWGNYSTPVLWNIWAKGENSIHLDLDNLVDSMLYSDSNERISGDVVTNPTLYDGSTPVNENITWTLDTQEPEKNYTFDNTTGQLTVNGISPDQNTVIYSIIATYKKAEYVSSLTIKKFVGVDKYDLVVTPNSITYNTSIGDKSASTKSVNIQVCRTSQGEGRKLITNLNNYTPIEIHVDGTDISSKYTASGYTFVPDYTKSSIEIDLIKDDIVVDTETIPINKSTNGDSGEDAINVVLTPSSIILTQDPETNEIDFTNAASQVKLYKGLEEIKTGFSIDEVIIDDGANENTVEAGPIGDDKIVIDGIIDNPTSGKIEVIVKYENNTYSSILQYAINWVGTWSATIKNDVYKAVASKTFSYLDENEKLVEVNGISTIEQSAEGIKSDVEQIKTTQTSQQQTISSIQLTSESLTTRISSVEDRQDGQDQTISSIELNIDKISLQVDSYQESIDSHTKSISELNISKNGIETRVSTTETLLGKVSTTLSNHASAIEQTAEQINLKVGSDLLLKTGINITSGKITLSADNTIFNGNVQFNGLIVEATKNSYGSGFVPIDMVNTSSVTAKAGDLVLLPAQQTEYDDFELSIGGGDNNTNGYKPSQFFKAGAKLSITNPYDATVSAWRLIQNNETYRTYLGNPNDNTEADDILAQYEQEYKNLLSKAVLVVSDPRLFNGYGKSIGLLQQDDTFGGTTIVASNQDTARWGGLFSCGGAIGRLVLVLPGQSLKLTSSIVTLGGREWLIWNVDNPEEFVPISKNVYLLHGWEEDSRENYEVVASNLWLNKYTPSMSVVASHSGTDKNASMFGPKILCDTNSGTDYYEYIHIYLDEAFDNNTSVYYPKFEIE